MALLAVVTFMVRPWRHLSPLHERFGNTDAADMWQRRQCAFRGRVYCRDGGATCNAMRFRRMIWHLREASGAVVSTAGVEGRRHTSSLGSLCAYVLYVQRAHLRGGLV